MSKSKNRKDFGRGVIIDTLVKQDFRCAGCNERFTKGRRPHFDHKDSNARNNSPENCQALCPNCHDEKSRDENRKKAELDRKNRDNPSYIDPNLFKI